MGRVKTVSDKPGQRVYTIYRYRSRNGHGQGVQLTKEGPRHNFFRCDEGHNGDVATYHSHGLYVSSNQTFSTIVTFMQYRHGECIFLVRVMEQLTTMSSTSVFIITGSYRAMMGLPALLSVPDQGSMAYNNVIWEIEME